MVFEELHRETKGLSAVGVVIAKGVDLTDRDRPRGHAAKMHAFGI